MSQYKVRNWSEYNESLKKRGSLSLWISDDAIKKWKARRNPRFIGAPTQYSNDAILCMLMVKSVYNLPYRQLIGFLIQIIQLMCLNLKVPHFTTVAKRSGQLKGKLTKISTRNPRHLVFDSSGFKVYGEGEWHARKHGKSQRRRWKKFHIGICAKTQEIILQQSTALETTDCEMGPKLIEKAPKSVRKVTGDGAYDTSKNYKSAFNRGIELIVPPRSGSVINQKDPWLRDRNKSILEIIGLGNDEIAVRIWKKLKGYHQRSLVETTFSRMKGIFGGRLYSKRIDNQEVELSVKAIILNKMTRIGMPDGIMV